MGGYDFGWAIQQLKDGKKVQRVDWLCGLWLSLMPGDEVIQPCIGYHMRQGHYQPGWVPTQEDMFADDWMLE